MFGPRSNVDAAALTPEKPATFQLSRRGPSEGANRRSRSPREPTGPGKQDSLIKMLLERSEGAPRPPTGGGERSPRRASARSGVGYGAKPHHDRVASDVCAACLGHT